MNLMKPRIIEINPTELCNRTCSFCPRSSGYPNRNLNLSIEDAKIIAERVKENNFTGTIYFTGHGEPTLNKNLKKIVNLFKNNGNYLHMISNGDNILKEKFDLWDDLDEITISVYEKENYEKFPDTVTKRPSWNLENTSNNVGGWFNPKTINKKCYYPFYKMYIDWDLNVNMCCHDWTNTIIGNLKYNTIEEVWNSDAIEAIREELFYGKRYKIPACKGCDVNGLLDGEEEFNAWTKQKEL